MSLLFKFHEQHLRAFGSNWLRFFIWGIALVILGLIAMGASTFTTLLSVIFLGVIIFISGVVLAIDTFTFWWGKQSGFLLHLILSLLYLFVGFTLIKNPIAGSISLTLLLGIFYIALGIVRLIFTSSMRAPMWGWAFFNGIITLLLGILIISSWPSSSLFVIGLFIGIDLFFSGIAYVMAALGAKKMLG